MLLVLHSDLSFHCWIEIKCFVFSLQLTTFQFLWKPVSKFNYNSIEWLFEVKVWQSFVGFTYQTNPLVISILFQDFLRIEEEFIFLERRYFFNWGVLIHTKKTSKRMLLLGWKIYGWFDNYLIYLFVFCWILDIDFHFLYKTVSTISLIILLRKFSINKNNYSFSERKSVKKYILYMFSLIFYMINLLSINYLYET